jgi:CRISPR system Cascade subunit CasC
VRLIELHILQSFPVSCLNRDDVGAPKTAIFGGANRARISSQCLKRAIRLAMHELAPEQCAGKRSRLIVDPLTDRIAAEFKSRPAAAGELGEGLRAAAETLAREFCDRLANIDEEAAEQKGLRRVKTMMFLSPGDLASAAAAIVEAAASTPGWAANLKGNEQTGKMAKKGREKKSKDDGQKWLDSVMSRGFKALREPGCKDAADIAIFGRMVANDPSLNVEGAAMFSHALSTHRADNEIDFFTAVDDLQAADPTVAEEDRAGSGMMGTLEFSSATYYRYAALNLGLLEDGQHLGGFSTEERRKVADAFVRAVLLSVPGARKNSMNAHTLPGFVLGLYRDHGHPVQLVNAFESPVKAKKDGLLAPSVEALEKHLRELRETWGLKPAAEVRLPSEGMTLDRFCEELVRHV